MCCGALITCAASCCVGCCCNSLKDCKVKYGPGSRIPYMFILFICSLFAICMVLFGEDILYENDLLDFSFQICNSASCVGNGAVYRTSFCLFVFFVIHAFLVYFVLSFHFLFFTIKLFCLFVVLTITFFIPGDFFEGYSQFARVASGIFLLIQIYVLLGWAWDTNDRINAKIIKYDSEEVSPDADEDEQGNKPALCFFKFLMIGATIVVYAVTFTFWALLFEWFVYFGDNCDFEQAMLAVLIVLVLILTVLPPIIQYGSLFTTAIVSFYCTFLVYSALESSPNKECNYFATKDSSYSMWLGILITTCAISYTGFSVSKNGLGLTDGSSSYDYDLNEADRKKQAKKEKNDDDDDGSEDGLGTSNYDDAAVDRTVTSDDDLNPKTAALVAEKKANVIFHICMAFSSVYMCMLYTGWGDSSATSTGKARGWTSVWVNLASFWVTVLLYSWTLLAPKLCPGRFEPRSAQDDEEINMEI